MAGEIFKEDESCSGKFCPVNFQRVKKMKPNIRIYFFCLDLGPLKSIGYKFSNMYDSKRRLINLHIHATCVGKNVMEIKRAVSNKVWITHEVHHGWRTDSFSCLPK